MMTDEEAEEYYSEVDEMNDGNTSDSIGMPYKFDRIIQNEDD